MRDAQRVTHARAAAIGSQQHVKRQQLCPVAAATTAPATATSATATTASTASTLAAFEHHRLARGQGTWPERTTATAPTAPTAPTSAG